MKHPAKIALLLAAAAAPGGWIPDSPILRVGEDVDVYFTAKGRLDYDSNLFTGTPTQLPKSGSSWILGPGFTADFFKEAQFSSTFSIRRDFVRYFDSALKGLDDERDVGGATFTYDGGGPLTLRLQGSYSEDARNTPDTAFQAPIDGTLLRQTNYSQGATIGYRLTEKLSVTLDANHASNRYDPKLIRPGFVLPDLYNTSSLTESDSWTFPLSIRFQVRERLNIGFAYEHGHTNISPARGSSSTPLYPGFTKDFYGLTFSGQPTESGKLDATLRVGMLRSVYDGGKDPANNLSYSASLTHALTEKTNHALNFSDDASVAVNGLRNQSRSFQYLVNYVMDESFRATAFVGLNTNSIGSTNVRTGSFGANATYSPDSHWTYVASYSLTQAYKPNSFNVNQFSLEANLRW